MAPPKIVDAPEVRPRHGRLPRRHPVRRIVGIVALGLTVVLVATVGVVGISFLQLQGDVETVDLAGDPPPAFAEQQGAFNILLVGSDSREGQGSVDDGYTGGALNDVTMVLHVSEDHQRATVVSFPRDLLIDFPACPNPDGGDDIPPARTQQLNTALGRGGLACVAEVVESISGLEIPYAALIGFDGVVNMSSAVGGVPVCFAGDIDDPYTGFSITEGTHDIEGQQALAFLRMRHGVGDGSDLARISSQQVFLSSLIRKLQSDAVLTDLGRLYQIAQVATSSMTMSSSLNDVGTMVAMARVLADIPLDTMQFIQYPSASNGTGRVVPTAVADEVMALIAADQPVTLDPNATGQGAEATQDPTATTDPGATDPAATDPAASDPAASDPAASDPATSDPAASDPSASAPPSTPIEGVQGTSASQQTCVVPYQY
ncbi:LCP family protein [Agrococcus sp. SGAir0287]|uniref:LCP family protein n=1 Tax=Agrococcus sp. SGAir0287 TaxID=2070347 RepID=UPI001586293D|nr:LCP family protein [Agrococcus sp. SGAir0287]